MLIRRPHPKALLPHKQESIDLVVYAGGMTAARAFNFMALYGDNTVVGNRMSAADLGAYKNAYQLAAVPAQLLGQVMDRVIFPVLSRFQENKERVANAYLRGIALVAMITVPASIVVVLLGPEVIHVLLGGGNKWDDAIVPFQIFAAGLIFRTSYKISDSLARAMGTVYRRAWRQAVYAGAVIVGALIGTAFGLVWVAVGVSVRHLPELPAHGRPQHPDRTDRLVALRGPPDPRPVARTRRRGSERARGVRDAVGGRERHRHDPRDAARGDDRAAAGVASRPRADPRRRR